MLRYIANSLKKCLDVVHDSDVDLLIEINGNRYSVDKLAKPCSSCILRFFCIMFRNLRKYCTGCVL